LGRSGSGRPGIYGASVIGQIATGRRAGEPVLRIGRRRDAPVVALGGERQAHIDGFDLHANVAVPAGDRSRLEHLARYDATLAAVGSNALLGGTTHQGRGEAPRLECQRAMT